MFLCVSLFVNFHVDTPPQAALPLMQVLFLRKNGRLYTKPSSRPSWESLPFVLTRYGFWLFLLQNDLSLTGFLLLCFPGSFLLYVPLSDIADSLTGTNLPSISDGF